jgi:hypothetical protein
LLFDVKQHVVLLPLSAPAAVQVWGRMQFNRIKCNQPQEHPLAITMDNIEQFQLGGEGFLVPPGAIAST